jgi:hypothetical protein
MALALSSLDLNIIVESFVSGLPDFSWNNKPKRGKIHQNGHIRYQMTIKYTKMAISIPNDHEIHQNFPSQGLPHNTKAGIFGMKI